MIGMFQIIDPAVLRPGVLLHNPKKQYHCSQCDKYYKQKAHLTRHKKSHGDNVMRRENSNPFKQFTNRLKSYQPSVNIESI